MWDKGRGKSLNAVTKQYIGITVRTVLVFVLGFLALMAVFYASEPDKAYRSWLKDDTVRHYSEYSAKLDEFLEQGDYLGVHYFCELHYIENKKFSGERHLYAYYKYDPIIDACNQYVNIYFGIFEEISEGKRENIHLGCRNLYKFYEATRLRSYYYKNDEYFAGSEWADGRATLRKMEERMAVLLEAYCGLTPEEIASFPDMSRDELETFFEEKEEYGE